MRQVGCIGGGTTEMARNVISERVLGMPRERTFDRDLPSATCRGAHRRAPDRRATTKRRHHDMTLFDAFRYDGKRALVVGGATGMGAAAAELLLDPGAEVVVMDFAEVTLPGVKAIQLNLGRQGTRIDAAVDECGGPVDALFSCAGVADGTPGIEKINFIGHRHLIDRLLAGGCCRGARRSASSRRPPGWAGRRTSRC